MTVNIIKTYHISKYNQDMHRLYFDLADYISNRFPTGVNLQPNERIVFVNDDIDFYINGNYPGFSLYNLQLLLAHLDIPNFFCAVISNTPNYKFYTDMVRNILRPNDVPLRGISSLAHCISSIVERSVTHEPDLNCDQVKHPFMSLSRLSRFHRTFFMAKLFERNLQNKGLVNYHNIPDKEDPRYRNMPPPPLETVDTPFSFLSTKPFVPDNHNEIHLLEEHHRNLIVNFGNDVKKYSNFYDHNNIYNKGTSGHLQSAPTQQALVYVGLETVAIYPAPFLSLISFKGIATKRPFIILGAPGTIKYLQDLGFRTFNQWWDESYDSELNFETRTSMIISLVEQISHYPPHRLQEICAEMSDILEYNYQHLTSTFIAQEQEKIDLILNQQFI